jgi:DNA-binding response OmpR family regulator
MTDVLIVDDDDVFGELLVERLAAAGIEAGLQHGPFGTLNRLRRDRPRVLIVDVNMPAISGREICDLVRRTVSVPNTKLLLMSSMDPAQLDAVRIEVGADGALSKSTGRAEFISLVRELLRAARN